MKRLFTLIIFILLMVGALMAGAWLANHQGWVAFSWFGYAVEIRSGAAIILLCLVFLVLFTVFELLFGLLRIPGRMRDRRALKTTRQSLSLITQSLCALAEKDLPEAKKLSNRLQTSANQLDDLKPIAHILAARAAELENDKQLAAQHYQQLSNFDATRPLALTGMQAQARRDGNVAAMLEFAEERHSLHRTTESTLALLESYEQAGDWEAILDIIKRDTGRFMGAHLLPAELASNWAFRAYLALAKQASNDGQAPTQTALRYAIKANAEAPENAEAASLLMTLQASMGQLSAAKQTLKRIWKTAPNVALFRRLARIAALPPKKQLALAQAIAAQSSAHVESQLILAEASLAAKQFDKARNYANAVLAREERKEAHQVLKQADEQSEAKE